MAVDPDQSSSAFVTVAGHSASPWILHVPHASAEIPAAVRARIVLDDDELGAELTAMTDAHTDLLAGCIGERVKQGRPWSFINRVSRLVVDPERFADSSEVMNRVGMGAVYTRTSTGAPLRTDDEVHRAWLIAAYFEPYSRALAALVDDRLSVTGRAVILDVHSFPTSPLPYELYPNDQRPTFCLGTDARHTPSQLVDAAQAAFSGLGSVAVNQPFRGTYVPLRHYGHDDRVESIMLEIRRDAYLHRDGTPNRAAIERLAKAAARLIDGRERGRRNV